MFDPMFIPPREHPLVLGLAGALLPLMAQSMGNIREFHVAPDDLRHLDALRASRAILAPNHPTGNDPYVMYWLSRQVKQPFNYLAAREILDGMMGWVMNHLGTYSVIRGVADRESLRCTRKLLGELERKVVIFPEGEIYEHNDKLLAFQSGVAQIGFWVLDDLQKQGKPLQMPLVPVAIKYRLADSPRTAIENSLNALEKALDLSAAGQLTAYQRLRRVADRVLASLERVAGVTVPPEHTLDDRIPVLWQANLERVARRIGTTVNATQSPADQLHLLFHELKSWVGSLPEEYHDYDERLFRKRVQDATPLFEDLHRLQNFIALSGSYVAAEATGERFVEVLGRLEKEVFGQVRHTVLREARVRIAAPIPLETRYAEYRQNKRQVVAEVTQQLEGTIRELLRQAGADATPIAIDA